jgi:hypothetical protein
MNTTDTTETVPVKGVTLVEARRMGAFGMVTSFEVEPFENGWAMIVTTTDGLKKIIQSSRGRVRVFKSLKAMVTEIKTISGKAVESISFTI